MHVQGTLSYAYVEMIIVLISACRHVMPGPSRTRID